MGNHGLATIARTHYDHATEYEARPKSFSRIDRQTEYTDRTKNHLPAPATTRTDTTQTIIVVAQANRRPPP